MQSPRDGAGREVLQATHELLAAVGTLDFEAYEQLSDATLTCFEPDTKGHLVEGIPFHKVRWLAAPVPARACRRPQLHTRLCTLPNAPRASQYVIDFAKKAHKESAAPPSQNTIVSPHVRMLGENAAVVAYVRVTQSGEKLSTCQETRVWQRGADRVWKNVHIHRSSNL